MCFVCDLPQPSRCGFPQSSNSFLISHEFEHGFGNCARHSSFLDDVGAKPWRTPMGGRCAGRGARSYSPHRLCSCRNQRLNHSWLCWHQLRENYVGLNICGAGGRNTPVRHCVVDFGRGVAGVGRASIIRLEPIGWPYDMVRHDGHGRAADAVSCSPPHPKIIKFYC